MKQLFVNNFATALVGAVAAGDGILSVASATGLPTPGAGEYFLLTLVVLDANGNEDIWEVIKVTSRSGTTLTAARGQESTAARSWPDGTLVEARLTAGSMVELQSQINDIAANLTEAAVISGGTLNLAATTKEIVTVSLNANVTTVTLPNGVAGQTVKRTIVFTNTGSFTVSGWTGVTIEGGTAPVAATGSGAISEYSLVNVNNTGWRMHVDQGMLPGDYGVGSAGINSTDLNAITTPGWYKCGGTATGVPLSSILGYNVHYQGDANFGTMVATSYDNGALFTRIRQSGSWGVWKRQVGGSTIVTNDFDAITETNFYNNSSGAAVGIPLANRIFTLTHISLNSNAAMQFAVDTFDATTDQRAFIRTKSAAVWGAWYEVMPVGGYGVGGAAIALSNADTVTESGFYQVAGSTLGTLPTSAGTLMHIERGSSNAAFQILSALVGPGSAERVWTRTKRNDSTWTTWAENWTSRGANAITADTGSIGFGAGSGGTVTQATSKGTSVTLNKPSGRITMNNAALAAGASVFFTLTNTQMAATDLLIAQVSAGAADRTVYRLDVYPGSGGAQIKVTNTSAGSLSEALQINFSVIKGAIA